MENRSSAAAEYFRQGYNCAQSVALAFSDLVPVSEAVLASLASPFGGGMGRLREVCGAFSGMLLVTGLLYGYSTPESGAVKNELYSEVQQLCQSFECRHSSIICRELLGLDIKHDSPQSAPRTPDFYSIRPCEALISSAAEILSDFIEEHPPVEKA